MVEVVCNWAKEPTGYLKIISLILNIICLGLFLEDFFTSVDPIIVEKLAKNATRPPPPELPEYFRQMCIVIAPSNVTVLFYFIFSYLLDDVVPGIHAKTEIIFDVVHAGLSIANSCISIYNHKISDEILIYGVFMLIIAVLLLVDAAFTCRLYQSIIHLE